MGCGPEANARIQALRIAAKNCRANLRENVGSQFLSLRQLFCNALSVPVGHLRIRPLRRQFCRSSELAGWQNTRGWALPRPQNSPKL
jgi:hypothetical protein